MSEILASQQNLQNSEQNPTIHIELSETEKDTIEEFKEILNQEILLQDSTRKEYFLAKLGIISFFYWGFLTIVTFYMLNNMNDFRRYYWQYRLNLLFYVYLMVWIIIKVTFSFAGHVLRKIGLGFFFIDIIFSYFVLVGLYFEMNVYLQTMYIFNGHYLVMFIYCMISNTLAFTASTIFKAKKTYNIILGFVLMEIATYAVIFYFENYIPNICMSNTRYLVLLTIITLINLYAAVDAYLMVNFRQKKYYESDYLLAFYNLWTDWFSFFWVDIMALKNQLNSKKLHRRYGENLQDLQRNEADFEDESDEEDYDSSEE